MVKNKTTQFLLPCLNIYKTRTEVYKDKNFLNAYIAHNENDKYEEPMLFLIFDKAPTDKNLYEGAIEQYEIHEFYVIVHRIPERFISDYTNFISGKYSEFSTEMKERIKNVWGDTSQPYEVITKNPGRRKFVEERIGQKLADNQELMSIMSEEEEIFITELQTI